MTKAVGVATIERPSGGEIHVKIEPNLHSGGRMAVIAQVRRDGILGPRIALRPSECERVASALKTAAAMLCGGGAVNHRTVIAADVQRQLEEDRKLF